MDDNWTRGVLEAGLVGMGISLSARSLDFPGWWITNLNGPYGSDFAVIRFNPIDGTLQVVDLSKTGGHVHFPYGYSVEAP